MSRTLGRGLYLHGTIDLGQVTVGNHLGWLVANTNLETSWAPINELDGSLGLESGNGDVDILGYNVTTVQQASSHVLSVAWVALHHLVVWLEARHGDLLYGVGFMGCLGSGDDGGVCNKREMDTWVWNQVGLELVEINVKGTIEAEGGSDGGDNCSQLAKLYRNQSSICNLNLP